MVSEAKIPITDFEQGILERLVKLETTVDLGFKSMDNALVLARTTAESDRNRVKSELDHRLTGINEFQHRIDRLEATYVTLTYLDAKLTNLNETIRALSISFNTQLKSISRIVYIGVGIAIALQFFFTYIVRVVK